MKEKESYYRNKRDLLGQNEPRGLTAAPSSWPFWMSSKRDLLKEEKRPTTGEGVPAAPSAWLFWMAARIWVVMLSTSCSMFLSATCLQKETYYRRKRDLLQEEKRHAVEAKETYT